MVKCFVLFFIGFFLLSGVVDKVSVKKQRGQFFTTNNNVCAVMSDLLLFPYQNNSEDDSCYCWNILEPSAGVGHLIEAIKKKDYGKNINIFIEGWEIDSLIVPQNNQSIIVADFFKQSLKYDNYFDSIIGNPPYVAWRNVEAQVKQNSEYIKKKYSDKCNLYYLFMDRCIDLLKPGGELVFIQPREWLYSTSGKPLRSKILKTGNITHIIDSDEEKLFYDANVPAMMIIRYQKNNILNTSIDNDTNIQEKTHNIIYKRNILEKNNHWINKKIIELSEGYWCIIEDNNNDTLMTNNNVLCENFFDNCVKLSDYFDVKVGITSGADKIFNVHQHPHIKEFIKEKTVNKYLTTKGIEYFIDVNHIKDFNNIPPYTKDYLLSFKKILLNRKIKSFDDNNWWHYGALRNIGMMMSSRKRCYCFGRTRSDKPFFLNNDAKMFCGGLLGLFLKDNIGIDDSDDMMTVMIDFMNSSVFRNICLACGLDAGNKMTFQPATLESLPFPKLDYLLNHHIKPFH